MSNYPQMTARDAAEIGQIASEYAGIIAYDLAPPDDGPRHYCTDCPRLGDLALGESWSCPECGSRWTATEEEVPCQECGHERTERTWSYERGDRWDTAPKQERARAPMWTPFRNIISLSPCYRLAGGAMVHVKPDCHC